MVKCILNGIFDSYKVICRTYWIALVVFLGERPDSLSGLFAPEDMVCLEICSFCDSF